MEIDTTKSFKLHGPLTQKEREERMAKGLCLYCTGSHRIADCLNMSPGAKKQREADQQKAKASPASAGKA
jgi:hypothetical protein